MKERRMLKRRILLAIHPSFGLGAGSEFKAIVVGEYGAQQADARVMDEFSVEWLK